MRLEIITGTAAREAITSDEIVRRWDTLHRRCPWATAFQTHAFASAWYATYAAEWRPMLVYETDGAGVWSGLLALAVSSDGTYRIMYPPKKVLLPRKVLYVAIFDPEKGKDFTIVWRDADRTAFGKRVHIESFIHDKEYRFFKDEKGKLDLLLEGGVQPGRVQLQFVAAKRQRQKECDFDLGTLEFAGLTTRGQRLAPKPIARVKHLPAK